MQNREAATAEDERAGVAMGGGRDRVAAGSESAGVVVGGGSGREVVGGDGGRVAAGGEPVGVVVSGEGGRVVVGGGSGREVVGGEGGRVVVGGDGGRVAVGGESAGEIVGGGSLREVVGGDGGRVAASTEEATRGGRAGEVAGGELAGARLARRTMALGLVQAKFAVLSGRNFRRFYLGYATSLLGTAMSSVAIAFAVLESGGTATGLGVVFAANIVPMVAFMLGGGVIADRLGRRPVMLAADLARCLAQGTLAAAIILGRPQLWLFVVAAFVVGIGNAFFQPALSGLTVQLAPAGQIGDANALFAMAQPAAQVAGPALAGVLIAAASPATVIAVDAGSYAVSAIALGLLRFPEADLPGVRPPSLLRELREGWAEFTAHTWLWAETVQFALFNLITWGPYLVLGPLLAGQYLGGPRAWGAILACYGGGAVLGGLLALGRRPRRPLLVSTLTTFGFALPPLTLALHLPLAEVAIGALLAGLGSAFGGAISTTVTQQRVPSDALARVGAFNMVGAFAFGPIAFTAAGPVAAVLGARTVLGFGAAWAALCTAAVLAVPSVRRITWQTGPVNPDETGRPPS